MTTLITGGMGCIGLHTARAFLDAGEDAVITYFQTWREPSFMMDVYMDITRIKADTGYEPKYTVETGVRTTWRGSGLAMPGRSGTCMR